MSGETDVRKPLGVRATSEQRRILIEAAARDNRSVSSFVLNAALSAAQPQPYAKSRRSREEMKEIVDAARAALREANPTGRDILAEFLAERREAGERGE